MNTKNPTIAMVPEEWANILGMKGSTVFSKETEATKKNEMT